MKRGETGGGGTAVLANDGAIPSKHWQGGAEGHRNLLRDGSGMAHKDLGGF